jgi:hypothetical protein
MKRGHGPPPAIIEALSRNVSPPPQDAEASAKAIRSLPGSTPRHPPNQGSFRKGKLVRRVQTRTIETLRLNTIQTNWNIVDDHHHHVRGFKQRLWISATNGPTVQPWGDIWAWEPWYNDIDRGRLNRSSELSGNHTSSHLVEQREEQAKEMNLVLRSISVILRRFCNIP